MKIKLINKLLDVTKEITRVYTRLLLILQEEKQGLMENVLDTLIECVKKKENLSLELKLLEKTRKKIVGDIAIIFGVQRNEVNITFLSQNLTKPYSTEFLKIQTDLTSLLKKIRNLNRENEIFIKYSMDGIRESFDFFNELTSQKPTYHPTDGMKNSTEAGKMVSVQL